MFSLGAIGLYARSHDAIPAQASKKDIKMTRPSTSSSKHQSPDDSLPMDRLSTASIPDFLAPALDRPPSSQKLRQLSKQMKRASHLQRHFGHKAASSESSSVSSMAASDRLPWDLDLDNLTLVRKSSVRSTESSVPSRSRPESQHFAKGLFHRRGKSKRDSSAQSSSGSSIYSVDVSTEKTPVAGLKDGIMPLLFSRRKPRRDHLEQKRLQISSPFNFQHVTHTQRGPPIDETSPPNQLQPMDGWSSFDLVDKSQRQTSSVVPAAAMADVKDHHFARHHDGYPDVPSHTPPVPGTRRLFKHAWSQEQTQKDASSQPPPRPPRSPTQANYFFPLAPDPACRISSPLVRGQDNADRVVDSCAIREHTTDEALVQDRGRFSPQQRPLSQEKRYSRFVSNARDSTRSLAILSPPTCDTALPDVPEEEEHHGVSRQSRLSLSSITSSLRGSQSVPMLRSLAESQRPTSCTSETLGGLGITGSNPAAHQDTHSPIHAGMPARESWEDLIDYCYEHEAEADCDYQWERPSQEMARDSMTLPVNGLALCDGLQPDSDATLRPGQTPVPSLGLDVPSLSPASQGSSRAVSEATTPNSAFPDNFSLPRNDGRSLQPLNLLGASRASAISRISQDFVFTPSLLLPCDYQKQTLVRDNEWHGEADKEFMFGYCHQSAFHDDVMLSVAHSKDPLRTDHRFSTSTTDTNSTSRSNSTGRRVQSTNSSRTTLTCHTTSSTSLNKMAGASAAEKLPETGSDDGEWSCRTLVVPDLAPDKKMPLPQPTGLNRYHHRSHASENQVRDKAALSFPMESARPLRPRARTTSMSTQPPPPVGQYASFSRRQQVPMNGGQI
ncbi:uncharacterized protein UV8b_06298 [Ustilaginoidea virens]|uniref:CRIB domain-containing protein n=1 Tax=Ustilaginoidea virens TaxID=1159556 RepID=A0A063C2A7_USTVR|nr:uncharacterized protein UV8b_06298 [Ustilaginoidea virens]QUC22057.1 hypothetical protein UV8b_06298 [Ustilaginoidea virens]GAO18208.1 hypothetical protein UVI_02022750 [Ustilaginoidea virens]